MIFNYRFPEAVFFFFGSNNLKSKLTVLPDKTRENYRETPFRIFHNQVIIAIFFFFLFLIDINGNFHSTTKM